MKKDFYLDPPDYGVELDHGAEFKKAAPVVDDDSFWDNFVRADEEFEVQESSTEDADAAPPEALGESAAIDIHGPATTPSERLERSVILSGIRLRATSYEAFKRIPQARGMETFGNSNITTDGHGNVLDMPMINRRCFGDIVSFIKWGRYTAIKTIASKTKPGNFQEITSRCMRCPGLSACRTVGRERINSVPQLKAKLDEYQHATGDKWDKATVWHEFVDLVIRHWRWSTLDKERRSYHARRNVERQQAKRENDSKRRKEERRAQKDVNPFEFDSDDLKDERERRAKLLLEAISAKPAAHAVRHFSDSDARRIVDTWHARELARAAGIKTSAGKIGDILASAGCATKSGNALRARVHGDLAIISGLETPPGCWA